eukprot:scaffold81411_cov69-Phaeocystis_antarctica.AAC.2
MEVKKQEDEQLLREGSTSVFFPFDLTEDRLPPLPESPRGTPRSELGSISHASPRSEPESPRSAAPSEGVEAADNRGFDDAAEAPEQPCEVPLTLSEVNLALVRLFLNEAAGAPARVGRSQRRRAAKWRHRESQGAGGSAIPAPRLPPLAEE